MTDTNTEFGAVIPLKPGTPATEQNTIEHKPGTPAATSTGFNSLWERFDEYAADMKATPQTVVTGFTAIDTKLKFNGFTMLGGASGAGKTSLCLNIALYRAQKGLKTVFYSLEMPVFALVNRLICTVCGVDYIHAADYWQPFKDKAAEYMKNIYFVGINDIVTGDMPKFDTGEDSALIKTIKQVKDEARGKEPGDLLIIIDSLHLLPAAAADARAATNENVTKIRTLTDTYHVNTVVIGQSKRGEKSFEYISDIFDKKAQKHDTAQLRAQFRESALIEYAADALFYLLNSKEPPTAIGTEKKWLCAVKNRIADTGINSNDKIIGFDFDGVHYKFTDKYGYADCMECEDEAQNASSNGKQTGKQATPPQMTFKSKKK